MNFKFSRYLLYIAAIILILLLFILRMIFSYSSSSIVIESLKENVVSEVNIPYETEETVVLSTESYNNSSNSSTIFVYDPILDIYYTLDQFNELTLDILTHFKGIGTVTAQSIIDYRQKNGGFESFSELTEVNGIGAKKLLSILTNSK